MMQQLWRSMCEAAQTMSAQAECEPDIADTMKAAAGLVAHMLTSTFGIRLASQKFLSLACLCFAGAPMARGAYRTLQKKRQRQEAVETCGGEVVQTHRTSRHLPEDVLLYIMAFLDGPSLNALRLTSRDLRDVASRPHVWAELCLRRLFKETVPFAQFDEQSGFRMSVPCSSARQGLQIRRLCQQARALPVLPNSIFPEGVTRLSHDTYRFVRRVGVANRCVRAMTPLPRPSMPRGEVLMRKAAEMAGMQNLIPLRHLRRWGGAPRPFICPYVVKRSGADAEVQITPRLVSYYEVTVLEAGEQHGEIEETGRARGFHALPCIAVGLSTVEFKPYAGHVGRLPGWDSNSYGYHSDDGGFFHNRGVMQCTLGRGYGPGDTVGCGIDYTPGDHEGPRIFFTINGSMISYAKCVSADVDFFPTIGVDSNDPFRINLGHRPFRYDLQAHCARAMANAVEGGHISVPKRRAESQCTKQQCWRNSISSPPAATIHLRGVTAAVA